MQAENIFQPLTARMEKTSGTELRFSRLPDVYIFYQMLGCYRFPNALSTVTVKNSRTT